jgi:hypothetical protein
MSGKGAKMRRFVTLSVAALGVVFALSYAMPAVGGPRAVVSANPVKLAKKALKKATQADKRSKKALAEAQKVRTRSAPQGPPGSPGAQGPAGTPGAAGAPGTNAFGSLTYTQGIGGTTSSAEYVVDLAFCPSGQAPTGGSAAVSGAEKGGTVPELGDAGDVAVDSDDPADGFVDSWLAYAYNASGSAEILAFAVCAPAASAAEAAAVVKSRPDPRSEALRELLKER